MVCNITIPSHHVNLTWVDKGKSFAPFYLALYVPSTVILYIIPLVTMRGPNDT